MEQHITAGGNQKLVSPILRRITGWALLASSLGTDLRLYRIWCCNCCLRRLRLVGISIENSTMNLKQYKLVR